ncbi:MAG: M23 family metallopeptidase [Candidatus Peregrinibacteria bacterium]
MTLFTWGKSLVNTFERNARHSRLKKIRPLLKNWESMERSLSPEEKALERGFFRRVGFPSILFFLLFTAVPYLQRIDENFWPLFPTDVTPAFSEDFSIADDGFFAKSSIPTQKGDRSDVNEIFQYTVKSGDTLSSIAYKFDLRVRTLLDNNEIDNPNRLKTGTVLTILPVDGFRYQVSDGDTVEDIAKRYKIDANAVRRQNQIKGNEIAVGSFLLLPGARSLRPDPIPVIIQDLPRPEERMIAKKRNHLDIPPATASRPFSSSKKLLFPTNGNVTQYYHYGHYAIDIGNRSQPSTVAAADGVVVKAAYGWNSGYGNVIIIDHGGGMQTLYGHHEKLYVQEGDHVKAGQAIGRMGNSGNVHGATGIHLHFEVRINGAKKDPMGYF